MQAEPISINVTQDIKDYIRSKSDDLRVATTCEGPILLSVKISPPKPTDHVIVIGERRLYISAVQAQYIRTINAEMLPRCSLYKRSKK